LDHCGLVDRLDDDERRGLVDFLSTLPRKRRAKPGV
jgi:hypothetical protein